MRVSASSRPALTPPRCSVAPPPRYTRGISREGGVEREGGGGGEEKERDMLVLGSVRVYMLVLASVRLHNYACVGICECGRAYT